MNINQWRLCESKAKLNQTKVFNQIGGMKYLCNTLIQKGSVEGGMHFKCFKLVEIIIDITHYTSTLYRILSRCILNESELNCISFVYRVFLSRALISFYLFSLPNYGKIKCNPSRRKNSSSFGAKFPNMLSFILSSVCFLPFCTSTFPLLPLSFSLSLSFSRILPFILAYLQLNTCSLLSLPLRVACRSKQLLTADRRLSLFVFVSHSLPAVLSLY